MSFGEAQLPDGAARSDEFFGDIEAYYGTLDISLPVNNPDNLPYSLDVGYQGCADQGLCYPPEVSSFTLNKAVATDSDLVRNSSIFSRRLRLNIYALRTAHAAHFNRCSASW